MEYPRQYHVNHLFSIPLVVYEWSCALTGTSTGASEIRLNGIVHKSMHKAKTRPKFDLIFMPPQTGLEPVTNRLFYRNPTMSLISTLFTAVLYQYTKLLCFWFFLFIRKGVDIQFFKIEKLSERHVECKRDHMQRFNARILCKTAHDVIQRGLLYAAHRRQLVNCNSSALTQAANALHINLRILHCISLIISITRFRVKTMIICNLERITRIRVDKTNIFPLK